MFGQEVAVAVAPLRVVTCSHLHAPTIEKHRVIRQHCGPLVLGYQLQKLLRVYPERVCCRCVVYMEGKNSEISLEWDEDRESCFVLVCRAMTDLKLIRKPIESVGRVPVPVGGVKLV